MIHHSCQLEPARSLYCHVEIKNVGMTVQRVMADTRATQGGKQSNILAIRSKLGSLTGNINEFPSEMEFQ